MPELQTFPDPWSQVPAVKEAGTQALTDFQMAPVQPQPPTGEDLLQSWQGRQPAPMPSPQEGYDTITRAEGLLRKKRMLEMQRNAVKEIAESVKWDWMADKEVPETIEALSKSLKSNPGWPMTGPAMVEKLYELAPAKLGVQKMLYKEAGSWVRESNDLGFTSLPPRFKYAQPGDPDLAFFIEAAYRQAPEEKRGFLAKTAYAFVRGTEDAVSNLAEMGVRFGPGAVQPQDPRLWKPDSRAMNELLTFQRMREIRDAVSGTKEDPWYKRAVYGASGMVPVLAGSALAEAAGGPLMGTAYWAGQLAPEIASTLEKGGVEREKAQMTAALFAPVAAGCFRVQAKTLLSPAQQTGLVKALQSGVARGMLAKAKLFGLSTPKAWTTIEAQQALMGITNMAATEFGHWLDKNAPQVNKEQMTEEFVKGMVEGAPSLGLVMGAGYFMDGGKFLGAKILSGIGGKFENMAAAQMLKNDIKDVMNKVRMVKEHPRASPREKQYAQTVLDSFEAEQPLDPKLSLVNRVLQVADRLSRTPKPETQNVVLDPQTIEKAKQKVVEAMPPAEIPGNQAARAAGAVTIERLTEAQTKAARGQPVPVAVRQPEAPARREVHPIGDFVDRISEATDPAKVRAIEGELKGIAKRDKGFFSVEDWQDLRVLIDDKLMKFDAMNKLNAEQREGHRDDAKVIEKAQVDSQSDTERLTRVVSQMDQPTLDRFREEFAKTGAEMPGPDRSALRQAVWARQKQLKQVPAAVPQGPAAPEQGAPPEPVAAPAPAPKPAEVVSPSAGLGDIFVKKMTKISDQPMSKQSDLFKALAGEILAQKGALLQSPDLDRVRKVWLNLAGYALGLGRATERAKLLFERQRQPDVVPPEQMVPIKVGQDAERMVSVDFAARLGDSAKERTTELGRQLFTVRQEAGKKECKPIYDLEYRKGLGKPEFTFGNSIESGDLAGGVVNLSRYLEGLTDLKTQNKTVTETTRLVREMVEELKLRQQKARENLVVGTEEQIKNAEAKVKAATEERARVLLADHDNVNAVQQDLAVREGWTQDRIAAAEQAREEHMALRLGEQAQPEPKAQGMSARSPKGLSDMGMEKGGVDPAVMKEAPFYAEQILGGKLRVKDLADVPGLLRSVVDLISAKVASGEQSLEGLRDIPEVYNILKSRVGPKPEKKAAVPDPEIENMKVQVDADHQEYIESATQDYIQKAAEWGANMADADWKHRPDILAEIHQNILEGRSTSRVAAEIRRRNKVAVAIWEKKRGTGRAGPGLSMETVSAENEMVPTPESVRQLMAAEAVSAGVGRKLSPKAVEIYRAGTEKPPAINKLVKLWQDTKDKFGEMFVYGYEAIRNCPDAGKLVDWMRTYESSANISQREAALAVNSVVEPVVMMNTRTKQAKEALAAFSMVVATRNFIESWARGKDTSELAGALIEVIEKHPKLASQMKLGEEMAAMRQRMEAKTEKGRRPKGVTEAENRPYSLPLDYTIEDAIRDYEVIYHDAIQYPGMRLSLDAHEAITRAMGAEMESMDLLKRGSAREFYMPHQVLDYYAAQAAGENRPFVPTRIVERFGGYSKQRRGSTKAIDMDYRLVMTRTMERFLMDKATSEFLRMVCNHYQNWGMAKQVGENLRAEGDHVFYNVGIGIRNKASAESSNLEKFAEMELAHSLLNDDPASAGAEWTADWLAAKYDLMQNQKVYCIPKSVADLLTHFRTPDREFRTMRKAVGVWKAAVILQTFPVYLKNQLFGDFEMLYRENARAVANVPAATKEMFLVSYRGLESEKIKALDKYGVIDSSFLVGDIDTAKRYRGLEDQPILQRVIGWPKEAYDQLRKLSQTRELVNRDALFTELARTEAGKKHLEKYYPRVVEDLKETFAVWQEKGKDGKAVEKRMLITRPEELAGLQKKAANGGPEFKLEVSYDRVGAKIAREAMVDYGRLTHFEKKWLRGFLVPFYSYFQANTTNWFKMGLSKRFPELLLKVGIARALLWGWNNLNPDNKEYERNVPEWLSKVPHLWMPSAKGEGNRLCLSLQATFEDAVNMAADPASQLTQMLGPQVKIPVALFAGKDVSTGFAIRPEDKVRYFLSNVLPLYNRWEATRRDVVRGRVENQWEGFSQGLLVGSAAKTYALRDLYRSERMRKRVWYNEVKSQISSVGRNRYLDAETRRERMRALAGLLRQGPPERASNFVGDLQAVAHYAATGQWGRALSRLPTPPTKIASGVAQNLLSVPE